MSTEDRTATTVAVVVTAPEGVQKYTARVSCTDGTIERVEPSVLTRFFEIAEGGEGAAFVRARAVDMTGEARSVDGSKPLFSLTFEEAVPVESISLHFETLLGHDGETIPNENVRFDVVE